MSSEGYRTLREGVEATGEIVDRRSRFIAQAVHVEDETAAEEFIALIRARHHDARHNVWAWVLDDGRERCSDDGEPQRTAGLPTLDTLRGAGLANVCCVVTRYFGGTLLGPGGLVRAYAAATKEALDEAAKDGLVAEMCLVTPVVVQIPYAAYDRVAHMAEQAGAKLSDQSFTDDVQLTCTFRAGEEVPFLAAMRELGAGQELAHALESRFAEY